MTCVIIIADIFTVKINNFSCRSHDKWLLFYDRLRRDNVVDVLRYFGTFVSKFVGSTYGPSKIAKPAVFQAVLRGIGKSFQSAITAPRMNLTGYGNATAQS